MLSARVRAFWVRVKQGLVILRDRRRYFREVFLIQLAGWGFRFAAFWCFLEAFGVGGSVRNVLLVLGCSAVAAIVPFTPGGAGVQQALLVKVFAGTGAGATIAAYSVGQQIAVAAFSLAVGFAALVFIFGFRSFREAIARRPNRPRSRGRLKGCPAMLKGCPCSGGLAGDDRDEVAAGEEADLVVAELLGEVADGLGRQCLAAPERGLEAGEGGCELVAGDAQGAHERPSLRGAGRAGRR